LGGGVAAVVISTAAIGEFKHIIEVLNPDDFVVVFGCVAPQQPLRNPLMQFSPIESKYSMGLAQFVPNFCSESSLRPLVSDMVLQWELLARLSCLE
jgi:hypothetical protein